MGEYEISTIEKYLVRIRRKSGKIVGAGFLVDDEHIITCAHVVVDAWEGLDKDEKEKKSPEVYMDFPLIEPGKTVTAKVKEWRRPTDEDIAVLTLTNPKPNGAKPALLLTSDDLWGHEFRALGFPSGFDDGIYASGVIRGRIGANLIQIEDIKVPGSRVKQGFSGTPVWDQTLKGVVGMVTEEDTETEDKVAFIIPNDVLIDVNPELEKIIERESDKGDPQLRLVIDRVSPLRENRGGRQYVYGTLTLGEGVKAYGEGLELQLSLENMSDVELLVKTVDVIIDDYDAFPIEGHKYSIIETSGTHLQIPSSNLSEPIELTEFSGHNSTLPVINSRLFLRGRGNLESQHTLNFSLVARAYGAWKIHIRATFTDMAQSYEIREVNSDVLQIVKR